MDTGTSFIIVHTTLSSLPNFCSSTYTHLKKSISLTGVSETLTGVPRSCPHSRKEPEAGLRGATAALPLPALDVGCGILSPGFLSGKKGPIFQKLWERWPESLTIQLSRNSRPGWEAEEPGPNTCSPGGNRSQTASAWVPWLLHGPLTCNQDPRPPLTRSPSPFFLRTGFLTLSLPLSFPKCCSPSSHLSSGLTSLICHNMDVRDFLAWDGFVKLTICSALKGSDHIIQPQKKKEFCHSQAHGRTLRTSCGAKSAGEGQILCSLARGI